MLGLMNLQCIEHGRCILEKNLNVVGCRTVGKEN